MHIHCLQHVAYETPGTILDWAKINNHTLSYTLFFNADFSLPNIKNLDVLLILGGGMNVYEEEKYPWLKSEKLFIKQAIDANKKVIGICLGSQLIAAALGSKVYNAAEKEIGFFPITFTPNALDHKLFNHFTNPYTVFHWHGDTFDLPTQAQLVASTSNCNNQAFLIGNNVLGMQFHFEMNEAVINNMVLHDGEELLELGDFIQTKENIKNNLEILSQNKKDLNSLLNKFIHEL